MNLLKKISDWIIVIAILAVLSMFFYQGGMKQFPRAIHAWAQSDRYALALNFEKNNFNFFLPETYVLNPQFPAEKTPVPEKGITRVDFPIHEYIIALVMKVTGNNSPLIFRFYILLWGLLGLFFLFQVARQLTSSLLSSCFVVVFAFTAPVYTYYQNGFLPSIPALSAMMGGYYFYLRYRHSQKYFELLISIALFTLAALVRTPFAIFLIAVSAQIVLCFLHEKKWSWKDILPSFLGAAIIAGYFLYNHHLGIKYGSVFLSDIMLPSSLGEIREILTTIRHNWLFEYLTKWHYIFLALVSVTGIVFMFIRQKNTSLLRGSWLQFGIASLGVLFYFFCMMKQFTAHDYYFLDTFFPLVLLFLMLMCAPLPTAHINYRSIILLIYLAFACLFIIKDQKIQTFRYTAGSQNPIDESIHDFTGAKEFLDKSGVPANARMLVLNAYSPNIPLILMDRKGYSVFGAEPGEALMFINKSWDYAVIQENMPVLDLFKKDSALYLHMQRIASNGKISLYRRCAPKNGTSLMDLLGLNEQTITYYDSLSFEPDSVNLKKTFGDAIHSDPKAGTSVLEMLPEREFLELLNAKEDEMHSTDAKRLFVSGFIKSDTTVKNQWPELVLGINDPQGAYVYYSWRIGPYLRPAPNGWYFFAFQYAIPEHRTPSDIIKLYWWNNTKGHYLIDDVKLISGR